MVCTARGRRQVSFWLRLDATDSDRVPKAYERVRRVWAHLYESVIHDHPGISLWL